MALAIRISQADATMMAKPEMRASVKFLIIKRRGVKHPYSRADATDDDASTTANLGAVHRMLDHFDAVAHLRDCQGKSGGDMGRMCGGEFRGYGIGARPESVFVNWYS